MSTLRKIPGAIGSHFLTIYAGLAVIYLLMPIVTVALFSFNDPVGRSNYAWASFTFDNWLTLFRDPTLVDAVGLGTLALGEGLRLTVDLGLTGISMVGLLIVHPTSLVDVALWWCGAGVVALIVSSPRSVQRHSTV